MGAVSKSGSGGGKGRPEEHTENATAVVEDVTNANGFDKGEGGGGGWGGAKGWWSGEWR